MSKRWGRYGGRFVPEVLWGPLQEVSRAYEEAMEERRFRALEERWRRDRLGRPTPLTRLVALSEEVGGAQLWVKREDLLDGGSFCGTSALRQALLAREMGKKEIIGETATGEFGIALGALGAAMGLDVTVFMGRAAIQSQKINVERMERLGVHLESVNGSSRGRSHAMAKALRRWASQGQEGRVFYATSSLASPDPYPQMVADALSVVGQECRDQLELEGVRPSALVAPVGSGSLAAGLFQPEIEGESEEGDALLVGVQSAGGEEQKRHAAVLRDGRSGIFLGTHSLVLQDDQGQVMTPHAKGWGVAMPVIGPQHAHWSEEGDAVYRQVDDETAVEARRKLALIEGIDASLESGYAMAEAMEMARDMDEDQHVVVVISATGVRGLGGESTRGDR